MDAIFDTEQMLLMSNYMNTSYLESSQNTLMDYSKEPDYPRQYTRWMILNAAEQSLLHFEDTDTDHITELAQNLIFMVPTEELKKNTCLRHTFKLDKTSWLHNKTFVITGELQDVDRESLTALLEGYGAHVRGHVSRFTDFVIAGHHLMDGRPFVEGSKYRRMVDLNKRREHPHMWIQLLHEPQIRSILPEQDWEHASNVTAERKRNEEHTEVDRAAQVLCELKQVIQPNNGSIATTRVSFNDDSMHIDKTTTSPWVEQRAKDATQKDEEAVRKEAAHLIELIGWVLQQVASSKQKAGGSGGEFQPISFVNFSAEFKARHGKSWGEGYQPRHGSLLAFLKTATKSPAAIFELCGSGKLIGFKKGLGPRKAAAVIAGARAGTTTTLVKKPLTTPIGVSSTGMQQSKEKTTPLKTTSRPVTRSMTKRRRLA